MFGIVSLIEKLSGIFSFLSNFFCEEKIKVLSTSTKFEVIFQSVDFGTGKSKLVRSSKSPYPSYLIVYPPDGDIVMKKICSTQPCPNKRTITKSEKYFNIKLFGFIFYGIMVQKIH